MPQPQQDRLIYSYIAHLFQKTSLIPGDPFPCGDFRQYVKDYKIADKAGLTSKGKYEALIDAFLREVKAGGWKGQVLKLGESTIFCLFLYSERGAGMLASLDRQLEF